MKVTQKKLEDGKLHLEATATVAEVEQAFNAAQVAFAQQMNLRPQPEKTIDQVAEEVMGIKDLDSVVGAQAAEYLTPFALDKKDIVPAFPPKAVPASALKRGAEYRFTLDVEPKPHYELTSYEKVAFTMPPFGIDEREVENQLAQMADTYAEYRADDPRPVQDGDHVLLSIEASQNGKPLSGLTTEGRTYTTGAGFMPDSFDKEIVGMEIGETKTFDFTGPGIDDKGNEIEETIQCTVTVKEMQKRVIPALTDAWVKQNMPTFDSVESLKEAIRGQLTAAHQEEYETLKRQSAASEAAKRFEGKIADPVYEAMRDNLMNNLRSQLQQQNIKFEQFVAQNGGEQQFSMMVMMQTRQNLVEGYALDAVFRHEKMTLTDEDILAACRSMNAQQQPQAVRDQMEKAGCGFVIREAASRLKASKWLADNADVTVAERK